MFDAGSITVGRSHIVLTPSVAVRFLGGVLMSYDVKIRRVAPLKAMSVRFKTSMREIQADMQRIYREVWRYIGRNGGKPTGKCFAIYYVGHFNPHNIDVDAGFPVKDFIHGNGRIRENAVDGGVMAGAVHRGPYEEITGAYEAIAKWVEENGYELVVNPRMREIYLNNPSKVRPEERETEVLWPVRKKKSLVSSNSIS
jgi:effector-binding domain-containing protein